jgi:hypothetical protein
MKFITIRPKPNVRDIDPESEKDLAEIGKCVQESFMSGLEYMSQIGHTLLEKLGQETRAILSNNYAEIALGDVPTISMIVMGSPTKQEVLGLVVTPVNWVETCTEDAQFHFGGIVFVASQVVDFYNVRPHGMMERARSMEAEYIKSLDGVILNEYQKNILSQYPNGWDKTLEYEHKPVELVN